ncbi:MAG: selenite/tellurite reduction operon c-type cytochrome lipoprotein ExtS [Syntrophales bacterium]
MPFAIFLLATAGAAAPARENACVTCHRPHHADAGTCTGCHRGNDRSSRKEIAHHDLIAARFAHFTLADSPVTGRGRVLIEDLACRRCHTARGTGNRLAADLDGTAPKVSPPDIFNSIKTPVQFMPNFHCDDTQIISMVNAVLAEEKSAVDGKAQQVQVVHFAEDKSHDEHRFVTQCGPCHKVLSKQFGGLGSGDIGPNLSGLFSEFYPRTYRQAERWTPARLKKWLQNPRAIRPNARMRPARLTEDELTILQETLHAGPHNAFPLPLELKRAAGRHRSR